MNRLATSTSPYLRQHADNPVHWFEWGEEAFSEARRRGVPIFLSVGYSACHWCHVMAHESFEDPQTAALLNDAFVNVKVDREERPDVDAVYMRAVQAMSGRGGWPMSVFLTPGGAPFYAGTYWPKEALHGMPDFQRVVTAVREAWDERRDEVLGSAERIATALDELQGPEGADRLDTGILAPAVDVVVTRAWDRELGGFGRAPKFPQAMTIAWLLDHHRRTGHPEALEAAVHSLDAMARGGIHDLLTGGFARYSTDARWLVPHFEKMLYDNALLLPAYATAAVLADRRDLAEVARSTATWLLTTARATSDGTFVSAFDADSEGEEGRFAVWSYDELAAELAALGVDVERWTGILGASPTGNFEGRNVLHLPQPLAQVAVTDGSDPQELATTWERIRAHLAARRAHRVQPGVDHKALTDWNALAVLGLVRAGLALDEPSWIDAGAEVAEVLHDRHVVDGRLHHVRTEGTTAIEGFLDDHALLALADLALLEATGDARWYHRALALAEQVQARFHDPEHGGWFTTAHDAERLVARPKETFDNAQPAGTSVMIEVCLRLAGLTGDLAWRRHAEEALRLVQPLASEAPTGAGWALQQLEALAAGLREVVVVGPDGPARAALVATARRHAGPGTTVLVADDDHGDEVPVLTGRRGLDGRPAAYVCRELACERPITEPAALTPLLIDDHPQPASGAARPGGPVL
ncbi:MAG: thioredoxin domain-containing protein [Nitriliruptoraceae bacterium]